MKKLLLAFLSLFCSLNFTGVFAQDKPDGFASVSGKGLETTTGGEGGEVIVAETYSSLARFARSDDPYIIIVKGTFAQTRFTQLSIGSNTTIVGYGTDATLKNIELHMERKQNVIIRNLTIRDSYVEGDWEGKENDNDGIQADSCHHVWIDHCFISHCGDGLIDLRFSPDYITVSNNHLSNHNKAFGIGWTENTDFRITIHHNWIDSTNQRNPSFDQGIGHLYNNYLSNIASYGNLSRGHGRLVVQNSVFEDANNPISMSGDGVLYSEGNQFISCTGNTRGNLTSMPFNPADYYAYTLDPTNTVKEWAMANTGPQQFVSDQYDVLLSTNKTLETAREINYYVAKGSKNLTLKTHGSKQVLVTIYGLNGQKMYSQNLEISNLQQIPLENLNAGIYLVQLQMENKTESGKFILN